MTMAAQMIALAQRAISEPREAASDLLRLGVPSEVIVPGLVLVVLLSVIVNSVAELVAPTAMATIPPFLLAVFFGIVFAGFSIAIWQIGRLLGGTGTLRDSLLLTAFLQGIVLVAQLVQLMLLLALPVIAGLFSVAVFLLGIWLNLNFIDALHGFRSLGRSFAVFFLSSLAVAVLLVLIASMAGVRVGGPM